MIWMTHEGVIYRMQVRHYRRVLSYITAGTPPQEAINMTVPATARMGLVEANITGFDAARARDCLDSYNSGLKTEVTSKPPQQNTGADLGVFYRVDITEMEFAKILKAIGALENVQKLGDANMWRSFPHGPVVAMVFYLGRGKMEARYWLRSKLLPPGVKVLEDENGNKP